MTATVTVLGSANMDLVGTAARLPQAGETVLGDGFAMIPGGKGANQAVAAARAGGDCTIIAVVGDDTFGPLLRAGLARRRRATPTWCGCSPGPSGVALIAVDDAGENQILVAPGANADARALTDAELAAVDRRRRAGLPAGDADRRGRRRRPTRPAAPACRVVVNAAPARPLPADLLDVDRSAGRQPGRGRDPHRR